MDKLNIEIKSILPYVIEAFAFVYGEEYHSIISKKINNAAIMIYKDVEGLKDYISYLKRCKSREYSIKLLEEIGIDVKKYKKDNYTELLNNKVEEILECLIGSSFKGFSKEVDKYSPLRAFNKNNKTDPKKLLKNKMELINYFLDKSHETITKENFISFSETEEYSKLLKIINNYNNIYDKLLNEYNEWAKQFQPYEKYIEEEEKRKEAILKRKKEELFRECFENLPPLVKRILITKPLEEQYDILFGKSDIASTSFLEYFSEEKIEKLKSNSTDIWFQFTKSAIILNQSKYLKKLGINIPDKKNIDNYLNFLNQDSVKKYIPSQEFIKDFSTNREKKYEEALKAYYTTREDFIEIMKVFNNDTKVIDYLYNNVFKTKSIYIYGNGGHNDNQEFISLMFYTIKEGFGGYLSHAFLHECGHIIDQSQKGIGFESIDQFGENQELNPYDKNYRKYEKFNEVLNDIFTIEAITYLQEKNIYLIEPKEFTSLDTSNLNTNLITKNILYPLLRKYRPYIVKAKINADPEELTKYIGKDNFEELVDVVNKVDFLARNDVEYKMKKSLEDPMVIEYFDQLERVKQIYSNIDEYYASNFEHDLQNDYSEFAKKR